MIYPALSLKIKDRCARLEPCPSPESRNQYLRAMIEPFEQFQLRKDYLANFNNRGDRRGGILTLRMLKLPRCHKRLHRPDAALHRRVTPSKEYPLGNEEGRREGRRGGAVEEVDASSLDQNP